MPAGASFNVMIDAGGSGGGTLAQQITASANTSSNSTFINNPQTNGNPNAVVFDTSNDTPASPVPGFPPCSDCSVDPAPAGVWWSYSGGDAAVFNEDQSPMPLSTGFNLISYPG